MAALPMAGCGGSGGFADYEYPPDAGPEPFTLQILHASDMEAGGEAVEYAPRFSAILSSLRKEYPSNTVVLSSGDNYLPGSFFAAGESQDTAVKEAIGAPAVGRADIALLNAMGFQASAFGNHEFDQGPGVIADLLQSASVTETVTDEEGNEVMVSYAYQGTTFPYLSANLDFSADADLGPLVGPDRQPANILDGQIARSALIKVPAGEIIGLVGATTPTLGSISNPGGVVVGPTDMDGNTLEEDYAKLADIIQAEVDGLTAMGIDKIILLAHMQQLAVEEQLATLLSDVDVIIAGGSNTLLADSNDRLRAGDVAVKSYPVELQSAENDPVLVINTDGNFHYVGRLVVTFDVEGVIELGSLDPDVNGVYAADAEGAAAYGDPIPEVAAIAEAVGAVIIAKDGNLIGKTSVFLDGLRTSVRTQETNLGNLTADANLAVAQEVDATTVISIKNGGGIRAPIGVFEFPEGSTNPDDAIQGPPAANPLAGKEEGQISQLDIENALRFNNDLTLLTLTAAQLQAVVEHAVSATEAGATPGRFPQIAGMTFTFDPTKEAGKRVVSLSVGTDDVVVDGALQTGVGPFRIVTLRFLAEGGDGYPFPTDAAANRVDLLGSADIDAAEITFAQVGSEQHALAKYLKLNHPADGTPPYDIAETPVEQYTRIKQVAPAALR